MRPTTAQEAVGATPEPLRDSIEGQQLPRIRFLVGPRPKLVFSNLRPPTSTSNAEEQATQVQVEENKDDSSTETDEDGQLIQRAKKVRDDMLKRQAQTKLAPGKRRRLHHARAPGVSLKTLINENLISPGDHVLSLDYLGKTETASINTDGIIEWKGMKFESPSSFSIHVKRLVNPSRKADDGWKTVKHNGRFLEYYKVELARKRCPQSRSPSHTSEPHRSSHAPAVLARDPTADTLQNTTPPLPTCSD